MNKKVIIWLSVILVVLVGGYFGIRALTNVATEVTEDMSMPGMRQGPGSGMRGESSDDISSMTDEEKEELKAQGLGTRDIGVAEIIYSGKVVPADEYSEYLDTSLEFNQLYVSEGDEVPAGTLLFDYVVEETSVTNETIVLKDDIHDIEEMIFDLEEYIVEIEGWIENIYNEDYETDEEYEEAIIMYNDLIDECRTQIAKYEIQIADKQDEFENLYEDTNEYAVYAEHDVIIYEIDENLINSSANNVSSSVFISMYSTNRTINIEISEYEMTYVTEGYEAEVAIEGLNETYVGQISSIDFFPNNLDDTDTSYYDTVISLDSSVPFGYSAVVTINLGAKQ